MRVIVHQTKSYVWVPLPSDVDFTPQDVASGKIRLDHHGAPRTRQVKDGDTHTECMLSELSIIEKIIHEKCRPTGGRTLSRKEAVSFFLAEHFAGEHFHRSWLTGHFEFHDDGPDEALAKGMFQKHVDCGNISQHEMDEHMKLYMEPATHEDHKKQHHKQFRVKA